MSTRNRYVLAGLAVVVMALCVVDYRSGNRKYEDLKASMAAENDAQDAAHAKKLAERDRRHNEEFTALERAQLANLTLLALLTDEALTEVSQAAEAELRKASKAWERRLDALKAEIVTQRARMEALVSAERRASNGRPCDDLEGKQRRRENLRVLKL